MANKEFNNICHVIVIFILNKPLILLNTFLKILKYIKSTFYMNSLEFRIKLNY